MITGKTLAETTAETVRNAEAKWVTNYVVVVPFGLLKDANDFVDRMVKEGMMLWVVGKEQKEENYDGRLAC